MDPSK